ITSRFESFLPKVILSSKISSKYLFISIRVRFETISSGSCVGKSRYNSIRCELITCETSIRLFKEWFQLLNVRLSRLDIVKRLFPLRFIAGHLRGRCLRLDLWKFYEDR